jgi:hypothetical protein
MDPSNQQLIPTGAFPLPNFTVPGSAPKLLPRISIFVPTGTEFTENSSIAGFVGVADLS